VSLKPAPVEETLKRLQKAYSDARCTLDFKSPLELLVATVLSAQCTDVRVNKTTPALFKKYRTARAYAEAVPAELEEAIRSCGFYHTKAKSIRGLCFAIVEKFGGRVPTTMEELVELPGVGRKTANVVLGNSGSRPGGFVVDTHVKRVAARLGWTKQTDPVKIEQDLNKLIPEKAWVRAGHELIQLGRRVCEARKPRCRDCPLNDLCPSAFAF
jgi:endonuclease-3